MSTPLARPCPSALHISGFPEPKEAYLDSGGTMAGLQIGKELAILKDRFLRNFMNEKKY